MSAAETGCCDYLGRPLKQLTFGSCLRMGVRQFAFQELPKPISGIIGEIFGLRVVHQAKENLVPWASAA